MADPDEHEQTPDPAPDIRESFAGIIKSEPTLGTTRKGQAKFYAKVAQPHWQAEDDGTFTKTGVTYHDLVAYKGTAIRAKERLAKDDYFIAQGRLEEYVSKSNGRTKTRFVAYKLGHDMAHTRYEVDRTPRRQAPERQAAERDVPEQRRNTPRQTPAFEQPEHRQDQQPPAMGM